MVFGGRLFIIQRILPLTCTTTTFIMLTRSAFSSSGIKRLTITTSPTFFNRSWGFKWIPKNNHAL